MAPGTSTMRPGSADGPLPGKAFQGLPIAVPYARWRGYGTEHGFHRGKITTFCSGDEDCPEGSFTIVFEAAEKCDPITLSWEQVLGIKKHGQVKQACALCGEPRGVTVAAAKELLSAWQRRVAREQEEEQEEDEDGEDEDADEAEEDEEEDEEATGGGGGVEELEEASGDEASDDESDGVRSRKKRAKKQRKARKAQAADPTWVEVDRAQPPARPVETPAFKWGGLKQRTTRVTTTDEAIAAFDKCWPETVKALRYKETIRYADEQDFDWDATGGPPGRPEVRRSLVTPVTSRLPPLHSLTTFRYTLTVRRFRCGRHDDVPGQVLRASRLLAAQILHVQREHRRALHVRALQRASP